MATGKPLSAKELQDLNTKLADRSFYGNTSDATKEDIEMFRRVAVMPNKALQPHLARWYLTISLKVQASHPHRAWPEAAGKKPAMKKNTADKVIDVKVVSVPAGEAREKPTSDASRFPLGAGAKNLKSTKGQHYVTTAINYANGWPHMGHAYEALTADVFARYHRLNGEDTFYLTGSDEHGAKIAEVAEANGVTPQASVDKYVDGFKALNQRLLISNDGYQRTTADAHKEVARAIWKICKDKGDIYLANYEGWYLTREERYVTEVEAQEWEYKDPGSGKPLEKRNEPSYFFRLSKYADPVLKHIKENAGFIQPEQYRTEILSRLESIEMRDLSISRGTFSWGIPCPEPLEQSGGQQHVMYVWFDALINYITGVHGIDKKHPHSKYWPAQQQIIGKDISWFHTVIWPSMLMSADIPLPKSVVVHGFIAGPDGRKMSKTYGNVVSAHDELEYVSADTFRWFLCRESAYGDELKYSRESMRLMHNADLCDNLGNLVNRAVKICGGSVPAADTKLVDMPFDLKKAKAEMALAYEQNRLSDAANITIQACKDTNKWVADLEPWKMKDAALEQKKAAVLRLLLEAVYVLAHFFSPFIPTAGDAIFKKLSTEPKAIESLKDHFDNLPTGAVVNSDSILFEPLEVDGAAPAAPAAGAAPKAEAKAAAKGAAKAVPKPEAKAEAKAKAKAEAKPAGKKGAPAADTADQPTFAKIDIRVGKVVDAWHHPGAERLFMEKIDVGEAEPRQIISGLREHYTVEEFKGRKLLAVCNLKPAKLVGEQSFGMVLCAKKDSKVELISVPDSCEVGQRVLPEGVSFDWKPFEPNQVAKKKVWDEIAKDLKTNGERFACFEGSPLVTENGTKFQAPSCSDSIIA